MSGPASNTQWWDDRWKIMEDTERETTLAMSPEERLCILAELMHAAKTLGWDERLDEDEKHTRQLWMEYRERWHARNSTP